MPSFSRLRQVRRACINQNEPRLLAKVFHKITAELISVDNCSLEYFLVHRNGFMMDENVMVERVLNNGFQVFFTALDSNLLKGYRQIRIVQELQKVIDFGRGGVFQAKLSDKAKGNPPRRADTSCTPGCWRNRCGTRGCRPGRH